ncbi:MAG: polysaccharide pyruvyl transferase CsaB [Clostridiales bacterium]|nr:polysaccharide pyruvyl transferase CsaB [Clostridiales bacterium]
MEKKKYRILMALMGLQIGGAETHVVELAKELHKQGHEIFVASNGGVYEKELTEAGIRHFCVPMNKRNIGKMIQSYFLLKKIIKEEKIEIVHSHARIPGFICGFLFKRMKFTFVTTAHWVFYTGMGLKYLTNWGQKIVAVSDDIKSYLIENYHRKAEDIYVTINGIDTDKFSPHTDPRRVQKEFHLHGQPVICHVSRLDESRALVARQLIEVAPKLCEKIPDLKILIAGSGDVFDELEAKSDVANRMIGRNCIELTGARTDINEIISVADVFVGVSRAALEAMSAGKPVVVAGNEGYIGLFDKSKLSLAQDSNFCCRGCVPSSPVLLYQDLVKAFDLEEIERKRLGDYGRQVIFDYYSVAKMANDCIEAYDAAYRLNHEKQYHVLMSGYYGFQNAGDEAILISIYKNLRKLSDNIHVCILSNNPAETRKKYGTEVVYRFSIWEVIRAIRKCDVLLSGGGSLLQDTTSTRSLIYYLSIIDLAKLFGKKVMLYANGIGPVSRPANRKRVKNVVNKADFITLREDNSLTELRSMGVDNKNIQVTADPVFSMDSIPKEESERLLNQAGVPTEKPIVGVSVRNWMDMESFAPILAKLCDEVSESFDRTIVFIMMQRPNDTVASQMVQQKMKQPSYLLEGNFTPNEIMGMISCMDFIFSMRLHTLIFAAKERVPLIGFVYDPKVKFYLEKLGMPAGGEIGQFDLNSALISTKDMIENRDKYVRILDKAVRELEEKAPLNEKYLLELLEK